MAFRYNINLVRESILRRRRESAIVQVLAVSLLIFALLLVATFGFYIGRGRQITKETGVTAELMQTMESKGLIAQSVADLREQSNNQREQLLAVGSVVESSAAWSRLLAAQAPQRSGCAAS